MNLTILLAIFTGVIVLLVLILRFKLQAFISLLIGSIVAGLCAGMEPKTVIETIKIGMGNTLGFVAVVVGLGAMFGAILEHSGGAQAIANFLLKKFKDKGTPWALMITGFIIAIPVFFDVAFIILIPMVYSLQRKSKKSLLLYAIPLLAGLAITHSFIPPTPGPVAVADILNADLGWVILFGFIVGIPTAICAGPLFATFISKKIHLEAPSQQTTHIDTESNPPSIGMLFLIIGLPIVLIVINTVLTSPLGSSFVSENVKQWLLMLGHPFVALILANLLAWYFLGLRRGASLASLQALTTRSLAPAGVIILLTGAGGVFKQMLIETGAGAMLANYFQSLGLGIFVVAFIVAALVRILQGSATVAMITAAGVTAAVMAPDTGAIDKALLVMAIASGASILSHVNDSGFWLVSKYLGMSEKQTFKSWSVMTTILAIVGMSTASLLSLIF